VLTDRELVLKCVSMETQAPTAAPDRFIRLVKKAMIGQRFTLRQLAEKSDLSPAYLSRLFNRERGLPTDERITKLEEVLDIQPRGLLFDAAERHDQVVTKVLKKDSERLLMRSLAPLTAEEFAQVVKVAERLAKKHQPEK